MARLAVTPRSSLIKTTLADGCIVYGQNRSGFGGRGIYLDRENIEPEFAQLKLLIGPGATFVDVGANSGIYSLRAARIVGEQGNVIAVEPFPDVFATLAFSVRENRLNNVRLRAMCVGDVTGEASFWMNARKPNSFSLVRHDAQAQRFSVLTVRLDDLMIWENLPRLDYLKVDAEGAEERVVAGGRETIERCRPIVQLELTVRAPRTAFRDYVTFRAPGSPNAVYMPAESPKVAVARGLGWSE
jgi:FkbM family methyltransferase